MFFKSKKSVDYKVIKLYKVVDVLAAEKFHLKNFTLNLLDYLENELGLVHNKYEFNYNGWRDKKSFEDNIKKMPDNRIVCVSIADKNDKSSITIENQLLNFNTPPEFGLINLELAITKSIYIHETVINFLKENYSLFPFDYGYLTQLNSKYDFTTEKRIKATILGGQLSVGEIDRAWQFHSIGVSYGYLKKIYKSNFLNNSHLNSPLIKNIIQDGIGTFTPINEKITLWSLDDSDMQIATERCIKAGKLIAEENSFSDFLNTEDAKKFKGLMKSD